MSLIAFDGVTLEPAGRTVLSRDLSIEAGEFVSLLGPDGAGRRC